MSAADRQDYAGYVAARLVAFREHAGWSARVWDFGKLKAARKSLTREDGDSFKGPWRTVRPYVTTEFREWVDEYNAERLTFAEWLQVAREVRREQSQRERDYLESVEFMTDELRRWRELCEDRDALIFEARERGASFKDLQDATGLSRMALHNVIVRVAGQSQAQAGGEVAA